MSNKQYKNDDDFRLLQQKYLMRCWAPQRRYEPIAVEKTDGCWIHTTDGRKIFDLRSAHECINLGFRHPKILQAMRDQMEKVVYVTDFIMEFIDEVLEIADDEGTE
jgi:taurine--2-oxoglutarate transaminase